MSSNFYRIATTSERLKEALSIRKMKQVDLVRITGLDKGSISHYVSGKYEPKQNAIYKLAKALNVSEMWLWGYDVPMERTETQKNNDILSDIVIKLRSDLDLMLTVEKLCQLDKDELEAINRMISAFKK